MRFFVRWYGHNKEMRHPRDMGATEVEAFLNMLANQRRVSASIKDSTASPLDVLRP